MIADKEITLTQALEEHPFTTYYSFTPSFCDVTVTSEIPSAIRNFVIFNESFQNYVITQ